jgi:hypothetical protein
MSSVCSSDSQIGKLLVEAMKLDLEFDKFCIKGTCGKLTPVGKYLPDGRAKTSMSPSELISPTAPP